MNMSLSFPLPLRPNVPERKSSKPLIGKSKALGACHLKQNTVSQLIKNDLYVFEEGYFDASYENAVISEAFSSHLCRVLGILKKHLPKNSKLVEVGCGKGHFFEMLEKDQWFTVKGYDKTYVGRNPLIEKRYLLPNEKVSADIVILRHVLDVIENPHKFLEMLSNIFGNALIFIELPNFEFILRNQMFHEVTYERVNYFTPHALTHLFTKTKEQGLFFNNHYQYILGSLSDLNTAYVETNDNPTNWVDLKFTDLFQKLDLLFQKIYSQSSGKKIYIWGGSTKGVLFCYHMKTYFQPLLDLIIGCVDINPEKQGKFLPYTHIPIISPEAFSSINKEPICLIVMNKNYYGEIKSYLKKINLDNIELFSLFDY